MTIEELADRIIGLVATRPRRPDHAEVTLRCNACYMDAPADDAAQVQGLITHTQHDHLTPADILVVRTELGVTAYELGVALGYPPRTDAEEEWRYERITAVVLGRR